MTRILIRMPMWRHKERMQHDNKGRDLSYAPSSKGTLKYVSKPPESRKRQGNVPLQTSERT